MNKLLLFSAILLLIISSGCLSNLHFNEGYTDVIIQKKHIDVGKEKSYYVLVTDKGQFEVERPLFDMFNPERNADRVWAQIEEGKQYRLHHYGYPLDFLNDYPIVVGVQPLNN